MHEHVEINTHDLPLSIFMSIKQITARKIQILKTKQ